MHLEGPWLSTTGKKKGKQKWASAEAKHKAELLQEQWKAAGDYSTNMGSRVHYELENKTIWQL